VADVLTPEQRKRCMSRVRNKNTDIELTFRKALWTAGFRYRLNYKLIGKPDLVFVGKNLAVFVDGCYWHGCPQHGQIPKTNEAFWREKIERNMARDAAINDSLVTAGWQVLRFWEHDIKLDLAQCLQKVKQTLILPNKREIMARR
jgi:DNA mismatch endonuclease (patch repair protein)